MIRIFVSYSHHDTNWKDRLVKHLNVLELEDSYDIWDDKKIEIGSNWLPEIEKALDNTRIAILMLSADFLTSPFIRETEIPRILERKHRHQWWRNTACVYYVKQASPSRGSKW